MVEVKGLHERPLGSTARGERKFFKSDGRMSEVTSVSVVVPLYNEEENVLPLLQALYETLRDLARWDYEVVVIDDGSTDGTLARLKAAQQEYERLRIVRLRRNFGQTAALAAGFDHAEGDVVVAIDGDLQNDPKDIPMLLEKLEDGYDIVSGWRKDRKDSFSRRLPSRIANWLISKITGVHLHDYGCTLKAYRREIFDELRLYGGMHRMIPAAASGVGISLAEIPVRHHPRVRGSTKYGISRTLSVVLDVITLKFFLSYAHRPMHLFGVVGLAAASLGIGVGIYLSIEKLVFGQPLADRPLLLLAALLVIAGLQLVTTGLLGELAVRTYHEAQGKPTYSVRQVLGETNVRQDVTEIGAASPTPGAAQGGVAAQED